MWLHFFFLAFLPLKGGSLSPALNVDRLVTTVEVMPCDCQGQAITGHAASILPAGTFTLEP